MQVWVVIDEDEDEGTDLGAVFATKEAAMAAVAADAEAMADDGFEYDIRWDYVDDFVASAVYVVDGKDTANGCTISMREVLS